MQRNGIRGANRADRKFSFELLALIKFAHDERD
jgi:hypothetical protein